MDEIVGVVDGDDVLIDFHADANVTLFVNVAPVSPVAGATCYLCQGPGPAKDPAQRLQQNHWQAGDVGVERPFSVVPGQTLWIGGAKGQRFRAVVAGRSVAAPVAPDPRDLFGWFAVNKDKWFTRVSNDNTSSVVGPAMITTLTGSWTFHSFKGAIGGFRLEGGCFYLLEGNSLNAEAGGGVCSGFVLSKTSVSGYVGPNW